MTKKSPVQANLEYLQTVIDKGKDWCYISELPHPESIKRTISAEGSPILKFVHPRVYLYEDGVVVKRGP